MKEREKKADTCTNRYLWSNDCDAKNKHTTHTVSRGEIAVLDPKLARLMQICGIDQLPPVHTKQVALDKIVIPGEAPVVASPRFIRSIDLVGIRQPPSVAFESGSAWDSPDATYVVVMGRRRIVSARHLMATRDDARFQTIKCEVYEWNAPRLNAFLGLVENEQRSQSWVADVVGLRQLIGEGIAMTLEDLKAYGFHAKTIKGRLDIALLPNAILDQICTGMVSLDVAMQVLRLKEAQLHHLETLVQDGEQVTADLVKSLLKKQVNQGLASVQTNLSQMWTAIASTVPDTAPISLSSPTVQELASRAQPATVLAVLKQFEVQTQHDPVLQRVSTLTKVLIKELEMVLHIPSITTREGETDPCLTIFQKLLPNLGAVANVRKVVSMLSVDLLPMEVHSNASCLILPCFCQMDST